MKLSGAQELMLMRMDVRKGDFWPSRRTEWATYRALQRRGLMHHREWETEDGEEDRTCKALTGAGMELVVRLLKERNDAKDDAGA